MSQNTLVLESAITGWPVWGLTWSGSSLRLLGLVAAQLRFFPHFKGPKKDGREMEKQKEKQMLDKMLDKMFETLMIG